MVIIRATISGHEVNLGVVEDDFDVEAWIESREASFELLGVTDVHGIHYPKFVIERPHDELLRERIGKLFSPD